MLINFFSTRASNADIGMVGDILRGALPMVRMQIGKADPVALNAMAQFLGQAFERIGSQDISASDFEQWLTELDLAIAHS